jgi:hypothetical protein
MSKEKNIKSGDGVLIKTKANELFFCRGAQNTTGKLLLVGHFLEAGTGRIRYCEHLGRKSRCKHPNSQAETCSVSGLIVPLSAIKTI